jgi:hypothetical protein
LAKGDDNVSAYLKRLIDDDRRDDVPAAGRIALNKQRCSASIDSSAARGRISEGRAAL